MRLKQQIPRYWLAMNFAGVQGGAIAVKAFFGVAGLSAAGVPVNQHRSQSRLLAVDLLDVLDPMQVYWAARLTLCADPDDLRSFDSAFALYFGAEPPPTGRPRDWIRMSIIGSSTIVPTVSSWASALVESFCISPSSCSPFCESVRKSVAIESSLSFVFSNNCQSLTAAMIATTVHKTSTQAITTIAMAAYVGISF